MLQFLLLTSLGLSVRAQVCNTVNVQLPATYVTGLCGSEGDPGVKVNDLQKHINVLQTENTVLKDSVSKLEHQIQTLSRLTTDLQCTSQTTAYVTQMLQSFRNQFYLNGSYHAPMCQPALPPYIPSRRNDLPRDCYDIFAWGQQRAGAYMLYPRGDSHPASAWCEDGWTYIQHRYDGRVDFNRYWAEYVTGFGQVVQEHWVGSDLIHYITSQATYVMKAEMIGWTGKLYWAQYFEFGVGPESDAYRLHVKNYTGNYKDGFSSLDGVQFSTKDDDNDRSHSNCAAKYRGAWWFNNCGWALNRELCNHSAYCANYVDRYVMRTLMKIIPNKVFKKAASGN